MFDEMDDLDEDEVIDEEDDMFGGLRSLSRKYLYEIWERAKSDELEDMNEEEKLYARIMMEHEDEFFNDFEFADVTHDYEYDPETESNPFLHIIIHSIVENQLEKRTPIEAYQFYNAMLKKGCARHDAVHLIGMVLTPIMFEVLRDQKPFDLDTYVYLLRKYKNRKPERIPDLLEKESRISFIES